MTTQDGMPPPDTRERSTARINLPAVHQQESLAGECPVESATGTYRTRPGDTLNDLAAACGISTAALAQLNHIVDVDHLPADLVLVLPGMQPVPVS